MVNLQFCDLLAFYEFILEPGKRFSFHPHAEVEITKPVMIRKKTLLLEAFPMKDLC